MIKIKALPMAERIDLQSEHCRSLRLKLFTYLHSFPKHDQIDSPEELKITLCERVPLIKVEFWSLAESRRLNEREVAYGGWDIPRKARTLTNTKPWDFSPPAPAIEAAIETKRSIIKDSQEVIPCYACEAKGEVGCEKCLASGKISCDRCEGSGRVGCKDCNGEGKQQRTRMEMREVKCGMCGVNAVVNLVALFDDNPYTRARRCSGCGGRGTVRKKVEVPFFINCKRCRASGKLSCGRCKTTGKIRCDTCNGKTLVGCKKCQRKTRLVKYLELERSFAVQRDVEAALPSPMEATRKLSPSLDVLFCDYESSIIAEGGDKRIDLEQIQIVGNQNTTLSSLLTEKIGTVIDAGRAALNGERVVSEKLAISKGEAFLFKYDHGNKSYIGFTKPGRSTLANSQNDAIAPHFSPVARWLRRQLRRAEEFAESGDQRTSGLVLNSCEEVSASDPYLQALIAESRTGKNLNIQYSEGPVKLPVPVLIAGGFGLAVGIIGVAVSFALKLPIVAVMTLMFGGAFIGLAYWLHKADLHLIEE